jgi:hypothetical protein
VHDLSASISGVILLAPDSLAICLFSKQVRQAMDGLPQVDSVDLERGFH